MEKLYKVRLSLNDGRSCFLGTDKMTAREAYDFLLSFYNHKFRNERKPCTRWSDAVQRDKKRGCGAKPTEKNGIRSFTYNDGLKYTMVEV